ncbi:MAG TPA: APC family permease, partial [Candidatus Bathyarchaeia archaeon]|nr:APC family permease [Candidatus Bathyarchaeia archaeon]
FPHGGFYAYAAHTIHPLAGFVSTWSYFTGKLASCALAIHVFVLFLQKICPFLQSYHPFLLDTAIIILFFYLNTYNVKTAGRVQTVLFALKILPITFIILLAPTLFAVENITNHCLWNNLPSTVPFVFFALLGFEACCSVSSHIAHAEKNAARAVIVSYGFVIILYIAYQLLFYGALGSLFDTIADYRGAFPAFLTLLIPHSSYTPYIEAVLHCAIASSALSASYGVLFSNMWNLHTLAQQGHIPFASLFTTLNAYHIPIACLAVEVVLALAYIIITGGYYASLQYMSVLGSVIAYTLSSLGLFVYHTKNPTHAHFSLSVGAIISCMLLLSICVYNIARTNYIPLILLGSLTVVGLFFFFSTAKKSQKFSA